MSDEFPDEYYSCKWIEGRIAFGFRNIYMCWVRHSGKKGYVHVTKFGGGPFPYETIDKKKNDLRRLNQTDRDTPCKGCPFLKKNKWQYHKNRFNMIGLSAFTLCNLKCAYCYAGKEDTQAYAGMKPAYNLYDSIKELVDNESIMKGAQVHWAGGEPTIHKDFDKILKILDKIEAFQTLYTNGTIYSDKIYRALELNRAKVVASVDAGTPELYSKIKGKDLFKSVFANLKKYASSGGEVVAKYVYLDENHGEAEFKAFLKECKKSNINKIMLEPEHINLMDSYSVLPHQVIVDMGEGVHLALQKEIDIVFGGRVAYMDRFRIILIVIELYLRDPDSVDIERLRALIKGWLSIGSHKLGQMALEMTKQGKAIQI